MKLILKSFVVVAVVLLASAASAGTLYWQVDGTSDQGALLWVEEKGINGSEELLSEGLIQTPTGIQQADITKYTGDQYRFYVELVNYSTGEHISDGYKWNYNDLVSSGYVAMDARDIPTVYANAEAHGNFAQAPEPTSGLLLLMGGAMLALRRRRQK